MQTTAASLLLQLRQPRSAEAWQRFVELYSPLLYHWLRGCRLQPADSADLVQEVLVAVLAHVAHFDRQRRGSFRAWLKAIVMSKVHTFLRRRKAEALPEALVPSVTPATLATWDAEYATTLLARALELVEPEFEPVTWKAFCLLQLEGKSAGQVAAELGVSRNAVYIARCRVLRRLRDEVEHLLD
jgi:RNA polymerase sigma-70 factor (ECF subfamily)